LPFGVSKQLVEILLPHDSVFRHSARATRENTVLAFVWNEPGFEEMMRCASVSKGHASEPISRDGVKAFYVHGDAELEIVQPAADKQP
jgi:hypothetical protein